MRAMVNHDGKLGAGNWYKESRPTNDGLMIWMGCYVGWAVEFAVSLDGLGYQSAERLEDQNVLAK